MLLSRVRPSNLQLTLAILKPDLLQHPPYHRRVQQMILDSDFLVVRSNTVHLSSSRAEQFYEEHREKFFYNRLVTFMSSGPCQPLVLAGRDSIARWRELMGPTKVFRTRFSHPQSVRGRFGLTDTRNVSHGSDSDQSASQEIRFFFPEFSLESWEEEEREHFQTGNIVFDRDNFVHRIRRSQS